MHSQRHPLSPPSTGTAREVVSFHFGKAGQGKKIYIQASLHADELPGMLVLQHLRRSLSTLEAQNKISGEIVLVPVANPIGLAQVLQGVPFGRFDLATGINFNRGYRHLTASLIEAVSGKLTAESAHNVQLIRTEAARILASWQPASETDSLKKTLQALASDADIVLDLHCDNDAVVHLYTGTPMATAVEPLSALLGAHAVLLARESGDHPFDEECARYWWELADHFGNAFPIPCACLAVTVELRGETSVTHDLAQEDAARLVDFMIHAGLITLPTPPLPASLCVPTPLEAVEPIVAPHGGLLVFVKQCGDRLKAGETFAELIDPVSGDVTALCASVAGVLFAHVARRYAQRGTVVAKIAGTIAYRTGNLLGQ
ncbi:MAG: succinylglutamate desuccinylase/aspartoacylase family protein [Herminiimonas sp.]|nr:succinylglutamate desuccinylase/aspartoacylase family protein [Herminiimonas sp.]